jgi:hypothetical protein
VRDRPTAASDILEKAVGITGCDRNRLTNDQEEPVDQKNAGNECDRNEAQNTGGSRALDVIGLVTGMIFRARAQRTHRGNAGEHRNPKEQRDRD